MVLAVRADIKDGLPADTKDIFCSSELWFGLTKKVA
jgi:hypothetical protein